MNPFNLLLAPLFVVVLIFQISGCATTQQLGALPVHCDDYMVGNVKDLASQGFTLVDSGSAGAHNGIVIYGTFINPTTRVALHDVLADNEAMVDELKTKGLEPAGQCIRGKTTWTILRSKELLPKVDAPKETGKET